MPPRRSAFDTDLVAAIFTTLVGLAFYGGISFALLGKFIGLWALLVPAAILLGWTGVEKLQTYQREQQGCLHGVRGAHTHPEKCGVCSAEAAKIAAAARAAQIEEAKRQEELRQEEYRQWVRRIRLPEYLRKIHPQEFERLVCDLYRRLGYEVQGTRYVGDEGIDGILARQGKRFVLQCKRVKGAVGQPVLRDLYGTMVANHADGAIVVTTGSVSRQAREWAQGKPIQLVELEELQDLIRSSYREDEVVPEDFAPMANSVCPRCGKPLRTIKGRRGYFRGCSGYPACRYTRSLTTRRRRG